jgi:hypothetical protein
MVYDGELCMTFDPPLDPGIRLAVEALNQGGVETFESCEGGPGHAYPEPTVRFHGDRAEGFRALSVAIRSGLPVSCLRRIWTVADGEPVGPHWELTLHGEARQDG